MEKFYGNISIPKLVHRARELGYPILVLALGIQMHLAPRALKAYNSFTIVLEHFYAHHEKRKPCSCSIITPAILLCFTRFVSPNL
jgi:hypothetical protein